MVLGHYGFGLGAKKFAPRLSLGTLFLAVQWADLLWPILLLFNVEHVALHPGDPKFPLDFTDYPITHSLLMGIVWGLVFGLLYWLIKKDTRSALVLGICVVSHWVLDLVVHKPDLPLFPGDSPKVGLGLWNWPLITAVVEFVLFFIGLTLYLRVSKPKNNTGKWSFWLLMALLVVNHIAALFSPMPSSAHAIGWAAQYQWIFVIMGYWVDRNRTTVQS
jgi:FtsH-binding integral membrane protein